MQKLQPMGQPTDGMIVAAGLPRAARGRHAHACGSRTTEAIGGWRMGASVDPRPGTRGTSACPRRARCGRRRCGRSRPGMAATCPPTTIVDCGECSRTRRHISRTLPTFDDDRARCRRCRSGASCSSCDEALARGKVQHACSGAEMLAWMSMRPQERWNMRSENGALLARDLVVVQLHRVDGAAAELVVLGVGAEDRGEQDTGPRAFRMAGHQADTSWVKRGSGVGQRAAAPRDGLLEHSPPRAGRRLRRPDVLAARTLGARAAVEGDRVAFAELVEGRVHAGRLVEEVTRCRPPLR